MNPGADRAHELSDAPQVDRSAALVEDDLRACREELAASRRQLEESVELLHAERHEHASTVEVLERVTAALSRQFSLQRRAWSGPETGWRRPLLLPGAAPGSRAEADEVDEVASSDLFDADWYLLHNPDVVRDGVDPALHYVRSGGFERRAPGPDFDAAAYVDEHPEIAEANVNPLLHFLRTRP